MSGFTSNELQDSDIYIIRLTFAALLKLDVAFISLGNIQFVLRSQRKALARDFFSVKSLVDSLKQSVVLGKKTHLESQNMDQRQHLLSTYDLTSDVTVTLPLSSYPEYSSDPASLVSAVQTSLTSSISSGNFTSTMQTQATQQGYDSSSTSLFTVAATSVTVTTFVVSTPSPTRAPSAKPGSTAGKIGGIIGGSIGGTFGALIILAVIFACIRRGSSSRVSVGVHNSPMTYPNFSGNYNNSNNSNPQAPIAYPTFSAVSPQQQIQPYGQPYGQARMAV